MTWSEKFADGATGEKTSKDYDDMKESLLPVATKEAQKGVKAFTPIDFQPVKSPRNYEAEFAVKEEDVIFHFWPWGYHEAQDRNTALPRFKPNFEKYLAQAMAEQFGTKVLISHDEDVGAIFVRVLGFGLNQFYRELAIKVCESLHQKFES